MQYRCLHCNIQFESKPKDKRFGSTFCSKSHYDAYRKDNANFDGLGRRREYDNFKRAVWGGSGKGANEVGAWAREFGRGFEELAISTILPAEGFTDIDDWSGHSNQFLIDFIATIDGRREFVDATCKFAAHVPQKVRLAESLRMPLSILHVSPANPTVYVLIRLAPGQVTSKVPMAVFHDLYAKLGRPLLNVPIQTYITGPRVPRLEKPCETCGTIMFVPERLQHRKRFCSRVCTGHSIKGNLVQFRHADQSSNKCSTETARLDGDHFELSQEDIRQTVAELAKARAR